MARVRLTEREMTETVSLLRWEAYLEHELADVVDARTAYEGDWQKKAEKILQRIDELGEEASLWSSPQQLVYALLAQVVAIRKVLQRLPGRDTGGRNWYFREPPVLSLARHLTIHLGNYLAVVETDEISQIPSQRVEELLVFLRSFIEGAPSHTMIPIEVYQMLWQSLLRHVASSLQEAKSWFAASVSDAEPSAVEGSSEQQTAVKTDLNQTRALIVLLVHGGKDDQAQNLLARSSAFDWTHALTIPSLLTRLEAVGRAVKWLKWLEDRVSERVLLHPLAEQWLFAGMASADVQNEALAFLRRHRVQEGYLYSQALLFFGHYRTWVEEQLLSGLFPNDLPRDALRRLEKEDSVQLLPMYHQAVERAVAQKNRAAYRIAVRWLKKLRTYYKKQKRVDEWQYFVVRFKAKYSRLRALQEELQRAGISD